MNNKNDNTDSKDLGEMKNKIDNNTDREEDLIHLGELSNKNDQNSIGKGDFYQPGETKNLNDNNTLMEEEHIQRGMSNSKDSKLKEGTNQNVAVKSPGLDPPSGQPDLASLDNQILVPSPFQNDINVQDKRPFIPECELIFEGGPNSLQLFDRCQKNPGHGRFIPVNEFKLAHLPAKYRTPNILLLIKFICNRTVKISVKYTSPNRPDTYPDSTIPYPYSKYKGNNRVVRVGSGIIVGRISLERNKPCLCSSCKTSGKPVMGYSWMWVKTASHVVFDDIEVESVVCDAFYNTEKREGVKLLYGVRGGKPDDYDVPGRCKSDAFYILCVTHELLELRMFTFLDHKTTNIRVPFSLIVSHPHGRTKHITIGDTCRMVIPRPPKHQHGSPIKFSPGLVECRLPENALHLMAVRLARFLGLESCRPGRWYTVFHVLVVFLPKDSGELCQGFIGKEPWVIFPKATLFRHEGYTYTIRLEGVLFNISRAAKELFPERDVPFYMEYDAPTCQGSSGAHVLNDGNYWHIDSLYSSCPHSGASMERKNMNRSGQCFCSQV